MGVAMLIVGDDAEQIRAKHRKGELNSEARNAQDSGGVSKAPEITRVEM